MVTNVNTTEDNRIKASVEIHSDDTSVTMTLKDMK